MHQFYSFVDLVAALFIQPRTSILFLLLILAAIYDIRTYRIPNWLTMGGVAFALIYTAFVPFPYQGGILWACGGLALGFLLMLPMYAVRAMGAGDVKLMAMAGSFLGVTDTLYAVLLTFIVGGIAALGFALANGVLKRMLSNIRGVMQTMMFSVLGGTCATAPLRMVDSVGKIPYGVSISIATMVYVVARQLGYW